MHKSLRLAVQYTVGLPQCHLMESLWASLFRNLNVFLSNAHFNRQGKGLERQCMSFFTCTFDSPEYRGYTEPRRGSRAWDSWVSVRNTKMRALLYSFWCYVMSIPFGALNSYVYAPATQGALVATSPGPCPVTSFEILHHRWEVEGGKQGYGERLWSAEL